MYILKGRKTDVKNVPGWVDGWHVKGVLGITYSGAIAERSRVCECSGFVVRSQVQIPPGDVFF